MFHGEMFLGRRGEEEYWIFLAVNGSKGFRMGHNVL